MEYNDILSNSFWVVPLVISIVQAIKLTGLSSKYSPLVSLAIGILLAFLVNDQVGLKETILGGVIYGLSASGLYSGVTSTQKFKELKTGELPLREVDVKSLSVEDIKEIKKEQELRNDILKK